MCSLVACPGRSDNKKCFSPLHLPKSSNKLFTLPIPLALSILSAHSGRALPAPAPPTPTLLGVKTCSYLSTQICLLDLDCLCVSLSDVLPVLSPCAARR